MPVDVVVPADDGLVKMDPTRDYRVHVGHLAACGGLWLEGGHNLVVIGGHVTIPAPCNGSYDRTAVKVRGSTGVVHLEGLLLDGAYLSDGVVTAAPQATLQLENVRIEYAHATENEHADCVQTQAGIGELRIDRLSCSTDLQGIFLDDKYGAVGRTEIRNVDIVGLPGKHLFFQATPSVGPVTLANVWLHTDRPWASFGFWTYPTSAGAGNGTGRRAVVMTSARKSRSRPRRAALRFVDSNVIGHIDRGRPAAGDFVPHAVVGEGYISPGYL